MLIDFAFAWIKKNINKISKKIAIFILKLFKLKKISLNIHIKDWEITARHFRLFKKILNYHNL